MAQPDDRLAVLLEKGIARGSRNLRRVPSEYMPILLARKLYLLRLQLGEAEGPMLMIHVTSRAMGDDHSPPRATETRRRGVKTIYLISVSPCLRGP